MPMTVILDLLYSYIFSLNEDPLFYLPINVHYFAKLLLIFKSGENKKKIVS